MWHMYCFGLLTKHCDLAIMDAFSPTLAHHWQTGQAAAADERVYGSNDDALSLGEQVALEELAERVSAARSVY
jgi:hypothetical protein